ncbi:hypothetical protein BV20DRAFT_1027357 [Pilatotrama ljubarskyi]|nr:hypothetical protein BV20DRAFT_1027357 [Pilatotrama ljubarskyi]
MQEVDFNPKDLAGFDAARELRRLDDYSEDTEASPFSADDRWIKGSVKIRLPKEGAPYLSEDEVPEFTVEEVYYRPILEVVTAACKDPCVRSWHFIPHKLFWLRDLPDDASDDSDSTPSTPAPASRAMPTSHASGSDQSSLDFVVRSESASPSGTDSEPEDEGIRVYSEAWHADVYLEEDARMRQQPREAGDPIDLEYAVLGMSLYSDSTQASTFGHASLWPLYAFFLSQSKYVRARPTSFAAHHLAYFPTLPDTLQDAYMKLYGLAATAAVLTFLKRELIQRIWLLLLDDAFVYAYVHGLVLLCGDDVRRRLFIRFLLYAADYPEKMLLACLKYFAKCPCPRCRINKDKIIEMGTRNDLFRRNRVRLDDNDAIYRTEMARRWVFQDGLPLTSAYIARVLDPLSLTPTRSAFSIRLREHSFNFYSLFVPDLLHEFELGVWKSTWIHLLRILYAVGEDTIQELNSRYRQVPSFGRSTIRRFASNVSSQGHLAARDFEARLLCFIPAYEHLLARKSDNKNVLELVFSLATWHALAKLREHTDITLDGLDNATVSVGRDVRVFAKSVCVNYVTFELPGKDDAARGRRKAAQTSKGKGRAAVRPPAATNTRKVKHFSYATYKFHAMRDFAPAIRAVAAGDGTSTQTGELEHCHAKRAYARTNKIKAAFQVAQSMRRAEKLRMIKLRVDAARAGRTASSEPGSEHDAEPARGNSREHLEGECLPYTANPLERYHIAHAQRDHDDLNAWVLANHGDLALIDFIPSLQEHILARNGIVPRDTASGYTPGDRAQVGFYNNRVYWHRVLRVNYTTYDRRRTQESINPRSHPDILLLASPGSEDQAHPYWYARVLRILHVNVCFLARDGRAPGVSERTRVDVLWVRWFHLDTSTPGGFQTRRLHRLQFVPCSSDQEPFGFVDPAAVVRGAHIIPAFAHGRTDSLLPGPSLARQAIAGKRFPTEQPAEGADYCYHYVNCFVDRDMFMRYYGNGIGHQGATIPSCAAFDGEGFTWRDIDEDILSDSSSSDESHTARNGTGEDKLLKAEGTGDTPSESQVHCEEDVLQLVPELREGRLGGRLHGRLLTSHDHATVDDDGIALDSEDEELEAHASLDVDEDLQENPQCMGPACDCSDEDAREDEYAAEGYAAP